MAHLGAASWSDIDIDLFLQLTQLYNALRFTPGNRAFARDVFARARDRYEDGVEFYLEGLLSALVSSLATLGDDIRTSWA
jgi:hypothetical protein